MLVAANLAVEANVDAGRAHRWVWSEVGALVLQPANFQGIGAAIQPVAQIRVLAVLLSHVSATDGEHKKKK